MDVKQVLSFIKIEHTLFSLPFVLMGYFIAIRQFNAGSDDLLWILLAAVGARGLAMALNRIIDRDIDAANPRTQGRHLASGDMSMQTAWTLCSRVSAVLLISAGLLNRSRPDDGLASCPDVRGLPLHEALHVGCVTSGSGCASASLLPVLGLPSLLMFTGGVPSRACSSTSNRVPVGMTILPDLHRCSVMDRRL